MKNIRKATVNDVTRIVEIVIFGFRMNFYPIFQNDDYYFDELQVHKVMPRYEAAIDKIWVYDDGVVKGFIWLEDREVKKLYVEPILQGKGIGAKLLNMAIREHDAEYLWALEKNTKAIRFYERYGFHLTGEKVPEEDTTEFLVRLERAETRREEL